MKKLPRKSFPYGIIVMFIMPLVIVYFLPKEMQNFVPFILGFLYLFAIIMSYVLIKKFQKNPYPYCWLVDTDTLIKFLQADEKSCAEDKLEAGFKFYMYHDTERALVKAWHFGFSPYEEEKKKGNVYYYNDEEYDSFDALINNKIKIIKDYILIELEYSTKELNDYKNNHPELDIGKYIEELKQQQP